MSIDTTTTAGKIAVMQAHAQDWRTIEFRKRHGTDEWSPLTERTPLAGDDPMWNWQVYDYRIKPREPREFFLAVYPEYDGRSDGSWGYVHGSLEAAEHGAHPRTDLKYIKVREVIE